MTNNALTRGGGAWDSALQPRKECGKHATLQALHTNHPIDGPRANRAQGTRRAADERVATILLAPNFVRPTGSVENLPEQPTRDTRETAKRAKRSLEEGGAPRKVRGAEKEYTGVLPGPADGVSARVARCDRRLVSDAWSLRQSSFHTWSKCGCHLCRTRTEPVLPMDLARTRYSHSVTQVFSSLFSRPFSIQSGPLGLGLR